MRVTPSMLAVSVLAASPAAWAGETITNPYAPTRRPVVVDLSQGPPRAAPIASGVSFHDLDDHMDRPVTTRPQGQLPAGWVQQGGVVVPQAVADGADVRSPTLTGHREATADKVIGPDADDLCAFPEQTPAGIYTGEFIRGTEFPRRGTIYMNYVGGIMQSGSENSAENQSLLAYNDYPYPVYGGGEEKAIAVAQAVQADYADMAVRVVFLERPPKLLPYVMIMMGGHYSDTSAGPSGGVAPGADCEDLGMRNVCYAFVSQQAINSQANVASQELGHTMGLGHTYGDDRVMAFGYDTNSPIDMGFGEECTAVLVAQGQGGYCGGVNKCHCGGDGTLQHDTRTLQAIYAPPGPDMVPPTITITAPPDGTIYATGETVTVQMAPEDDFGGYGWQLSIFDADTDALIAELVDYDAAQEFKLMGLPDGHYRLVAKVQDHADQVGEHAITITVGEVASMDSDVPTTSASSSDGSDGPDGESSGEPAGSSGEGSSGSSSEATPQEEVDDGCNCVASPGPQGLTLAALGLLGLRRRRRS
jgi:MYXO-CTERM domain-containing protein